MALADTIRFIREYWRDHTLVEGYAEACQEVTQILHEEMAESHSPAQALVGTGWSLIKLFGAIPIGLVDWEIQFLKRIPKGPGPALYKFFEVPIKAFYHGGVAVYESFRNWSQGSLNEQNSFAIADEVTSTLGTAALLLRGGEKMIDGGMTVGYQVKEVIGHVSYSPAYFGYCVALTWMGGTNFAAGAMYMTATGAWERAGSELTSFTARSFDLVNLKGPFKPWRRGRTIRKLLAQVEESLKAAPTTVMGGEWRTVAKKIQAYIDEQPPGAIRKVDQLKARAKAIAEMREHEVGSYAWARKSGLLSLEKGPWNVVRGERDLPRSAVKYVIQLDSKGYPRVRYGSADHVDMVSADQGRVVGAGWMRYDPDTKTLRIDGKSQAFPTLEAEKLAAVQTTLNKILGPNITTAIVPIVY